MIAIACPLPLSSLNFPVNISLFLLLFNILCHRFHPLSYDILRLSFYFFTNVWTLFSLHYFFNMVGLQWHSEEAREYQEVFVRCGFPHCKFKCSLLSSVSSTLCCMVHPSKHKRFSPTFFANICNGVLKYA